MFTFATKPAGTTLVSGVMDPKVAVPEKLPVMIEEPSVSAETPLPPYASARFAQAKEPSAFALATKKPPSLTDEMTPKVTVPAAGPVMIEEPSASAETLWPQSLAAPPALFAQAKEPSVFTLATKTS